MRKTIYILTFLIFNLKTFGQNQSNPWPKHYIPKNLNECLIQLDNILSDSLKNEIINYSESEFIGNTRLGLGMYLRNKWGLWQESRLAKYFTSIGVYHPESMSVIILQSYYRHLKGEPIDLIKQINNIRSIHNLPPKRNGDLSTEDSLMSFTPKWNPFDKVTHYIKLDLGARNVNFEDLNSMLANNDFPKLNSPSSYMSMGYFGNYKNFFWFLGFGLYPNLDESEGLKNIQGGGWDLIKIGSGYAIYRGQFIGLISSLNYGISRFDYTLTNTDDSNFLYNGESHSELEIVRYSQFLNPNVNLYYNLVPNYNKAIGLNIGYNFNLNQNENIKVNGIEISISFIIELFD